MRSARPEGRGAEERSQNYMRMVISVMQVVGFVGFPALYVYFSQVNPHREDPGSGHIYKLQLHGGFAFLTLAEQTLLWSTLGVFLAGGVLRVIFRKLRPEGDEKMNM